MRRARDVFAWSALAVLCACGARPSTPKSSVRSDLRYVVDVTKAPTLTVSAHLSTTGAGVVEVPDDMVATVVSFEVDRGGRFVALPLGQRFDVPECVRECRFRYTMDLTRANRSLDTVMSSEGGAVSPTYAWLARPRPLPVGTTHVAVDAPRLPAPVPGSEAFVDARAHSAAMEGGFSNDDFSEGSFAAFGAIRVAPISAPGAEIDLVRIGTLPKLGEPGLVRWARDAAACVAQLFGHFPVKRASVFVVPVKNADEVVFGKVLSLGGPAVLALTGEDLVEGDIHEDWVLVHEMMHLGAPTFNGPLRWLGEGTATYYEALLRTRSGWRTPKALWGEFARSMPRGVAAKGHERPLDEGEDIDDVYWGGALFLWNADVRLREKGSSLDDVMRGVLAEGGDGTQVWSIERFVASAARITHTNVIGDLYDAHGRGAAPIDLPKLLADLGIEGAGDAVRFHDDAPLAAIRKAIERQ